MGHVNKLADHEALLIKVEANASADRVSSCLRVIESAGEWTGKRLIIINIGPEIDFGIEKVELPLYAKMNSKLAN